MQDFLYELGYHHGKDLDCVADTIISLKQKDNNINIIKLQDSDIDSLTKDSPPHLLRALYTCKPFAICDKNKQSFITKENAGKILGYKSDFANIFVYGKDSLNDTYLQARKALYKTYQLIKQEQAEELQRSQEELEQQLQGLDSKQRESKLQELQRKQERELREKQREKERQEQRQARFSKNLANTYNTNNTQNLNTNNNVYITQDSNLILESKDKSNVTIFLDSANSLSNLIHIHNERIDIFTKDYTRLDIQELESLINKYNDNFRDSSNTESNNQESKLTLDSLYSSNTQIFLYSYLLTGGTESNKPHNECFFGELDKEGVFIESKPVYHLIGKTDYDTKDSKERFTQTLQVFLNGNTLTLLNYSIIDLTLKNLKQY